MLLVYSRGGLAANGTGSQTWDPMGHLRNGAVSKYCGVSMDTQMALGDSDASPHHAERRDHAPTGLNVHEALGLSLRLRLSHLPISSSPGAVRVSTDTP